MVEEKSIETKIAIIGGGPGGYVAAIKAAQMGADVVLIEKDKLGGTCTNWGCIPTKTLVRSAEIYKNIMGAEDFGLKVESDVKIDMPAVIKRKDKIVARLVKGIEYLLKKNNVNVINGMGKILDENTVLIEADDSRTTIKAENIIIATGSKISSIPFEGTELEDVIDSNQALIIDELPEEMVIVGGGIIGMEFASIYANFGVKITVVEYLDDILINVDSEISKELSRVARRKKIKIYTAARVEKITEDNNVCKVSFSRKGKEKKIAADKVLMAVGREPYYEGSGIKDLDIELNENGRGIKVNKKMQTSIPNIYAIGDVTDEILLAHVASHQGIVAVNNIMGEVEEMDYSAVPSAIFTDPEIATVGIDEKTAELEGIDYEVGEFPFSASGKALTMGENMGMVKLIKESSSAKIIGGSIVGVHATDLLAEITLAVKNGLTSKELIETIHAHPTTAEVIHEAALDLEGGAIHNV